MPGARFLLAVILVLSTSVAQDEGDLRNQTYVPTIDLAGQEALAAVREALARGTSTAEIRELSRAFLYEGEPSALVPVSDRLLVSRRRALLQAWIERAPRRRDLLGGVPRQRMEPSADLGDPEVRERVRLAAEDHPG